VSETFGCDDPTLDAALADVTDEEGDLWDAELDGLWTVSGNILRIDSEEGAMLEYTRAL
jgi:hypothetical protein